MRALIFVVLLAIGFHSSAQDAQAIQLNFGAHIKINAKACTYTIGITTREKRLDYVDGIGRYAYEGMPLGVTLYFHSSKHAWENRYTFAMHQSQLNILPLQLSHLKPHENVEKRFSLKTISVGVLRTLSVKPEALRQCDMSIEMKLYLDGACTSYITVTSDWVPCPECIVGDG